MLSGPLAAYTVLQNVRDACVDALSDNRPARVSIVPGAIAWDGCDQCGQLALASSRNFLSDVFPIELVTSDVMFPQPGALLCSDLVVQIIRCAPSPQGNDMMPTVTAEDASAQLVISDAYNVMCATIATLLQMKQTDDIDNFIIRQQIFVGPEGACVGSELTFTVSVVR